MIDGSCHCGVVRWTVPAPPEWLTRCTCSYCARSGALWASYAPAEVRLDYPIDAVIRYMQGDRTLAFISCARCGCTTHYEPADPAAAEARIKVNMRMAHGFDYAALPVRVFDGADSWRYLDD
ncbi:MAG: hypothetical protein KIS81_03920 [Maricaulaceae bacterium]|nr:hypothetical protein [Maricaulaceae bacterium]